VRPELHLLGITVQSFGLMLGAAFVVAGVLAGRRLVELGRPVDWSYEMTFAALAGGLAGARLWWVAGSSEGGSLLSGAGLVWYGGAIGGALCVAAWARWRGVLKAWLLDLVAVPLAAGYAVGRIGCQLAGDGDYGRAWDGPWAMAYPHGTVPITTPVHPTPVYETLAMGLVAVWLWRHRDAWPPGTLFGAYLVLAGAERFLVEFLRRNPRGAAGLTQPQLLSLVLAAGGVAWLLVLRRRAAVLRPRAEA
jgi:phosphatidylglycerol:prolipoprotein diacylglycerol transferase